ncbi:MAG: hypothetical protein F2825_00450 [Actinobacteria bacterium]|uniref:Unannotated protein n=1 Tax=freshwater metagenome TaxID=449393 RepID=A0A6J7FNH2_9ZZZZ|nr:hypothetical protein [Actinomycetota bacterium]
MSTTTRTDPATLRYLLGNGPRPHGVCPTIGSTLQGWLISTQPLTPVGVSHHQLAELVADTDHGPGTAAHRAWLLADHLAHHTVQRYASTLGHLTGPVGALPADCATHSGEALRLLTKTTSHLPVGDHGRRRSTSRALADGGIAGLIAGACTTPLQQPLAVAIAGACGELILRTACALTPEEAHHLTVAEREHTLRLLADLPADTAITDPTT